MAISQPIGNGPDATQVALNSGFSRCLRRFLAVLRLFENRSNRQNDSLREFLRGRLTLALCRFAEVTASAICRRSRRKRVVPMADLVISQAIGLWSHLLGVRPSVTVFLV